MTKQIIYTVVIGSAALLAIYLIPVSPDDVGNTLVSKVDKVEGVAPVLSSTLGGMEICGNKLSDTRKLVIAAQIDRISAKYLTKPEHRQAFVGLLCIESKFDSNAKSNAGAVGIAQLMPKYASYFSEQCGLGKVAEGDLTDTEVNLTLGACHFSKLLDALDGNIALALSGYNSGQDSETTRRLSHLAEGHPETMAYVAKFYTFLNKVQIANSGVISKSVAGKSTKGVK